MDGAGSNADCGLRVVTTTMERRVDGTTLAGDDQAAVGVDCFDGDAMIGSADGDAGNWPMDALCPGDDGTVMVIDDWRRPSGGF